jgi:hypothetical protein
LDWNQLIETLVEELVAEASELEVRFFCIYGVWLCAQDLRLRFTQEWNNLEKIMSAKHIKHEFVKLKEMQKRGTKGDYMLITIRTVICAMLFGFFCKAEQAHPSTICL